MPRLARVQLARIPAGPPPTTATLFSFQEAGYIRPDQVPALRRVMNAT